MTLQKLRDFLIANISCKEKMVEFIESIEVIDVEEDRVIKVVRVAVDTICNYIFPARGELDSRDNEELDHFVINIVCQAEAMEGVMVGFTLDDGEGVELFVEDCEVLDDGECLCTVVVPVKEGK